MIYFDNAATTRTKPPEVARAVADAIAGFGGAGRSAHTAALDAGRAVFHARELVAQLFNAPTPARVAFSCNATEALNIAIAGLLHEGDHAVTTAASHNSALRPLYRKQDEEGVGLSVLPVAPDASIDYAAFDDLFRDDTRAAVVTHASNLTGDGYDIARMAAIAHAHGALLVVDAAQTAGVVDIDMARDGIDVVCFTGHKSLFGPQGTGGLCVAEGIEIPPFKVGGTGMRSYDTCHPTSMPESLEAGTLNAHGIAGLAAGVSYVLDQGADNLGAKATALAARFEEGVRDVKGVRVVGGQGGSFRTGIVALVLDGYDSAEVADLLATEFGIATRAGAHCAPLMHEALGTKDGGAVRFSFSSFNTAEEVDVAVRAVRELAEDA